MTEVDLPGAHNGGNAQPAHLARRDPSQIVRTRNENGTEAEKFQTHTPKKSTKMDMTPFVVGAVVFGEISVPTIRDQMRNFRKTFFCLGVCFLMRFCLSEDHKGGQPWLFPNTGTTKAETAAQNRKRCAIHLLHARPQSVKAPSSKAEPTKNGKLKNWMTFAYPTCHDHSPANPAKGQWGKTAQMMTRSNHEDQTRTEKNNKKKFFRAQKAEASKAHFLEN